MSRSAARPRTSLRVRPVLAVPPVPALPPQRLSVWVIAMGVLVTLLVLAAAYSTDRNGDMDELAMYNPSYMVAHFGKITFPSYAYHKYYDLPVIIHPPLHVGLIGLIERLGFSWYYAEATPTVFFFIVGIAVVLSSRFPPPVQLGLLFSIAFLPLTGEIFATLFGTRPEGEVQAAWFAGLLLLESGRIASWSRARLCAGAIVLTWASFVHYYAGAASAGVIVYMVWGIRSLGWKNAWTRVLALAGGVAVVAIPYLLLYVIPNLNPILSAIRDSQGKTGVGGSLRSHFDLYRDWAHNPNAPAFLRGVLGLGIPVAVFSTILLWLVPSVRGMALAALPLEATILFLASHKQPFYLIHETTLFVAAIAIAALAFGARAVERANKAWLQRAFLPIAAATLALLLVADNSVLHAANFTFAPRVHEGDLARAASQALLGTDARVTGRFGAWYVSGAVHWHDLQAELLSPWAFYDARSYFENFDAVVEYPHMSEDTANKDSSTVSSWYADGLLKLRGFYFGETNPQLRFLFFGVRPSTQVAGYAKRKGRLYRFNEATTGDWVLSSAICPASVELHDANWNARWPDSYTCVLHLPARTPYDGSVVLTALMPHTKPEPAGFIGRSCRTILTVPGTLAPEDAGTLVNTLRKVDAPMRFYRTVEEVPRYSGIRVPKAMQPPENYIKLTKVIDLSRIQLSSPLARFEDTLPVRLTTVPLVENFSAAIPVRRGALANTPCWIDLRLRVTAGRIGFGAYQSSSGFFAGTPLPILQNNAPQEVALALNGLAKVAFIVLYSEKNYASQVEIQDASVLISPQDWERNKASLSPLR